MKYLILSIILLLPIISIAQKTVSNDPNSTSLLYVGGYYENLKKVPVFYMGEYKKCRIKRVEIINGYFKSMTIKLPNKKRYVIGYYNYLALIERLKVTDVYTDLEDGYITIGYDQRQNELNLRYTK